jgi:hypothetical protein
MDRCWTYFPEIGFGSTNYAENTNFFMIRHS